MGVKIKIIKIDKDVPLPNYAKSGDAGLDLYSAEEVTLKPGERYGVRTGVKMEIPDNHVGLIWDKSGVALNAGIKTMGGVVDSGYRGEVKVIMVNLSDRDFVIKKHSKIAQMLMKKFEQAEIEVVDELSKSERGEGAFGSTGLV
jgi:dUTP pyrophosphatase